MGTKRENFCENLEDYISKKGYYPDSIIKIMKEDDPKCNHFSVLTEELRAETNKAIQRFTEDVKGEENIFKYYTGEENNGKSGGILPPFNLLKLL